MQRYSVKFVKIYPNAEHFFTNGCEFFFSQVLVFRSPRKLRSQGNFPVIISKTFVCTLLETDKNILAGEVAWDFRF